MGRVLPLRTAGLGALLALVLAAPAAAAPVLILKHGHVTTRDERFAGPSDLPGPRAAPPSAQVRAARAAPKGRATRQALDALLTSGAIDGRTHDADRASINSALRTYRKLSGTRKTQLGAVIDNADSIAAARNLTASRLPAIFATLDANSEW